MDVEVQTRQGTVRGVRHGGVLSFKGIPFAAAPVGDLRFSPPAVSPSWDGVRDASEYGPIAPQHIDPLSVMIPGCELNFYHPGAVQDEDCLNLNIWVPEDADESARAVFVWIHGGAFLAGSGSGSWSDGGSLAAAEGIVVVTVNYRLGALGGLSPDRGETTGNNFLRDQIAALNWIRENIAAFGGDPEKVTIGGESAGAMSVVALMSVPQARGLFRAAIVQSGHGSLFTDKQMAHHAGRSYLAQLDLADRDPLPALRSVDLTTLLDAQLRLTAEVMLPFRPVVDGDMLSTEPLQIFRDGEQVRIPLLIGINADENNLFTVLGLGPRRMRAELTTLISEQFVHADPDVVDDLARTYRALEPTDVDAWNTLTTDRDWRTPVRDLSDAHSDAGAPVYTYEFTYQTPVLDGALRACHTLEIPFALGNLAQAGVSELVGDDDSRQPDREAIQRAMVQAWGSFVRTGKPVSAQLPAWPEYRSAERAVMMIGPRSRVAVDPAGPRLDRWEELSPSRHLLEF